ncbi:MAG: DUF4142 domain-containing protein [Acidobacteriota bacterium]|nr:DUF4142 domain-containing protein [Acidobacteriota bacterium]
MRETFGVSIGAFLLVGLLGSSAAAQSGTPQNRNPQNNAPQSGNSGLPRTDPANATSTDPVTPASPGFIGNPTSRNAYDVPADKISDRQFIERAVMRGLTQIEIGKLAMDKATKDSVKQFAQKIVDDRAKLDRDLARIAGKQGYAVPGSLDSRHQTRLDKLAKLSGEEFDRAYLKDQAKSQERDVQAFEWEAQSGTDAQLKAFALKTLPTMQEHLKAVKDLSN